MQLLNSIHTTASRTWAVRRSSGGLNGKLFRLNDIPLHQAHLSVPLQTGSYVNTEGSKSGGEKVSFDPDQGPSQSDTLLNSSCRSTRSKRVAKRSID